MTIYRCEDRTIEDCLKRLEAQVTAAGGLLHEAIEIKEEANELSLLSGLAPEDKRSMVIGLPEPALIPYEPNWVGVRNDHLYLKETSKSPLLTPSRRSLFETILELYNLTGKIEDLRKHSVYIACADDENMFRRLTAARDGIPTFEFVCNAKASNTFEDFLCNTFFHSRAFNFEGWMTGKPYLVLMPFIDFANHHHDAAQYQVSLGRLGLLNSRATENSKECFVHYGGFDTYDFFLNYGYVDRHTPFVRSVPLTVTLGDLGQIATGATLVKPPDPKLPSGVKDLKFFLPDVTMSQPGRLDTTFLLIPGARARFALRRVLAILINTLGAAPDAKKRILMIEDAENQILTKNIQFYEELLSFLATHKGEQQKTVREMAIAVAERQLVLLTDYKQRIPQL